MRAKLGDIHMYGQGVDRILLRRPIVSESFRAGAEYFRSGTKLV